MAFRRLGGYGQSYGGGYGAEADPLAAAIQGALGMGLQTFDMVRGIRQERADRRAEAARAQAEAERRAALDAREESRYQQQRSDAIIAEARADRREREREKRTADRENANYLRARGISVIPNGMGGTTYAKVALTDDELATAVADRQTVERLRQQAKALGIPDAEQMTRGELEILTSAALAQRKSDAEFKDFQRRENYQEGLFRGRAAARVPAGKALPAALAVNAGTYRALIGSADDALTKFDQAAGVDPETGKSTKSLTGILDGLRNTSLAQNIGLGMGPDAVSAVSALSNLASSIMKDRSGGAITPQEFERLSPFLPSKYDNEEAARQKIVDLRASLQAIHEERLNALEASGYEVGHLRYGGTSATAGGDEYDQKAADYLARRKKATTKGGW